METMTVGSKEHALDYDSVDMKVEKKASVLVDLTANNLVDV